MKFFSYLCIVEKMSEISLSYSYSELSAIRQPKNPFPAPNSPFLKIFKIEFLFMFS